MIPEKRDIIKKIGHGKCLKGKKALQKKKKNEKPINNINIFLKF